MRKTIVYLLCAVALFASCNKNERNTLDEAVSETTDVLLKVNGQYVRFEENKMQSCSGTNLFRAGNDDMSTFFCFTFDKYPSVEGENVGADLNWKLSGASQERKGLEMTVVRIEGEVIWLSAESGKINAVIRKD